MTARKKKDGAAGTLDPATLLPLLERPTAVIGTTGTGKTYAAKGVVELLLAEKRRTLVIDPTGAWYGLRAGKDGKARGGFPVVVLGGDHGDHPLTDADGADVAEVVAKRDVRMVLDLSEFSNSEKVRFLTPFLERLYTRNREALHLVVDEADEVAPQNPYPEEKRLQGAFDRIVRRGRIHGFRPMMITQRPAVIHKSVLSQIGTMVALRLTSPQDRKAVEGWIAGGDVDPGTARAMIASLPKLERGEGWVWSPVEGILDRVRFGPIRTFDSSRTPEIGEAAVTPDLAPVGIDDLAEALVAAKGDDADPDRPKASTGGSSAERSPKGPTSGRTAAVDRARKDGYRAGRAEGDAAGYERGLAEGIERGRAEVRDRIEGALADLPAGIGSTGRTTEPARTVAAGGEGTVARRGAEGVPDAVAAPKAAADGGKAFDPTTSPLYRTAMQVWPARLTWSQLAAASGRKARGGRFNEVRKALLSGGHVREVDGTVVLTRPPPTPEGVDPLDLMSDRLPAPANAIFDHVRAHPGSTAEEVARALGLAPRGGHWNGGMSMLKASGVLTGGRNLEVVAPRMEEAT